MSLSSGSPDEAAVEFDFDDPPDTKYHLTEHLTFGAQITLDFEYQKNYDLDGGEDDDLATIEPELQTAFSYDPVRWFRGFADFEFKREFDLEAPVDRDSPDTELIANQAYVNFREFWGGLSLTLGRQNFEDEREWLYDEELDAARLFFRHSDFGVEASVSREELVQKDLLDDALDGNPDNYFLYGRYALGEDSEAGAYLFFRDDRSRTDEDLIFLGLSSTGELASDLDYWAELAHVRGGVGTRNVRGYGVDLGATYAFDVPFEPSLTLGAAFGTGDDDPDDGTDRAFRQTGLQDNNDDFNGVTSFRYYGEVLDPELSNLLILTAGVGIRPTEGTSLDVVYHHYRQHRSSDGFRDVAIDAEPDGRSRSIGHGLDVIAGFREIENFDAEAVFGLLLPGGAFPNDTDPAYFVGVELEFSF